MGTLMGRIGADFFDGVIGGLGCCGIGTLITRIGRILADFFVMIWFG
jgi:hypothetical protein